MIKTFYNLIILSCFLVLNLDFWVKSQECSSTDNNDDYMGSLSVTNSNKPCQSWSRHPNSSQFEFIDSLADADRFCRNPLGSYRKDKAYCFTNVDRNEWEYCNITKCICCSKFHGIAYGSIEVKTSALNPDGSYPSGTKVTFSCQLKFTEYDNSSGPLEWRCNNCEWSAKKLPKCLWRGFFSEYTPKCWYYSENQVYDNQKPRRLYYGKLDNANGTKCLDWNNYPRFPDKSFPEEGKKNAKNYCRSPGDNEPLCPVSATSFKSCRVSKCKGCGAIPYVKYTSYDINYSLNLRDNSLDTGSYIKFSCSVGTLVGNSMVTCVNGVWNSTLPYCDIKFCSTPPPTPKNSVLYYRQVVNANIEDYGREYLMYDGTTFKYVCKPSYKFTDSSVNELAYVCKSGKWNLVGTNSSCELPNGMMPMPDVLCPSPKEVQNGYRAKTQLYKIATAEQYYGYFEIACRPGYKLIGNPNVTCVNGQWETYPTCQLQPGCSFDILYVEHENVDVVSQSLYYTPDTSGIMVGSYINFKCLDNYQPELTIDDLSVKCLDGGNWSTKIPVKCV